MSNPNATTEMAHWMSDKLPEWLRITGQLDSDELDKFVNRYVLPHLSPYGVNSMYEFMKEDFDDEELVHQKM